VVAAVKQVAEQLGNRPAICRKYYVHPAVIAAFLGGGLHEALGNAAAAVRRTAAATTANAVGEAGSAPALPAGGSAGLRQLEEETLELLRTLPVDAAPPGTKVGAPGSRRKRPGNLEPKGIKRAANRRRGPRR